MTEEDVQTRLTPGLAVQAARRAVLDSWHGWLSSPARVRAELGTADLVFTVGGYRDGPVGFRVYGKWPGASDQLVVVWSPGGEIRALVVGSELGIRRTGALGAVAADALARADARTVAVIGSGRQAWSQLWALTAVREIAGVRVFSPDQLHREAYADRARRELGLDGTAVDGPRQAVDGADIVVLATRSATAVIQAEWISDGSHVATVGPKLLSAHETPPGLADRAGVVVSDSPDQARAYGERFFTERTLVHLGAVLDGSAAGRAGPADVTMYCSTGLAGSEVVIADALTDAIPGSE